MTGKLLSFPANRIVRQRTSQLRGLARLMRDGWWLEERTPADRTFHPSIVIAFPRAKPPTRVAATRSPEAIEQKREQSHGNRKQCRRQANPDNRNQ